MTNVRFVFDKDDPLIDDVISIRIEGLDRGQKVTIKVDIRHGGYTYMSYGCFSANEKGELDLTRNPSVKGTYTGVSPMGLFWSMEPAPGEPDGIHLRCKKASFPLVYTMVAYKGHIDLSQQMSSEHNILCTAVIKRSYMAKGVQRILVRSGSIRGALFLPPGSGPFPGVIDLFGSVGSLVDFRGALLASRGFAVLCLPYFAVEDLPENLYDVSFDYFMEAAGWLSSHNCVISDCLGVLGISKGGEIALQMAYYSEKIKAVVSINGAPFLTGKPMPYQGELIGHSEMDFDKINYTEDGITFIHSFICTPDKYLPLWEKDVNVLLVVGGDDLCVDPTIFKQFQDRYPTHVKHNCERIKYEGAGHLIDPPYSPLFRKTERMLAGLDESDQNRKMKVVLLWGGQKVQHAYAQEDSWKRIIQHFRTHLKPNSDSVNRVEQNIINRTNQCKL